VGRQALEIELLKGALKHAPGRKAQTPPSLPGSRCLGQAGYELMGLSRSTYYDPAPVATAPGEVLVRIKATCDEFECYGYRWMRLCAIRS